MSMWTKIRNSLGKLSFSRNQVVSESYYGANLTLQSMSCEGCMEESNRVCKCDIDPAQQHSISHDDQHHGEANSSFLHAVINMIGMLLGLGQLSTPYALQNGGWTSSLLLIGLGAISAYTSHLLGLCLEKKTKSRSYADIGHDAFGNRGRILATTFIYMEIFMALVSYTISLHDNIITVFAGTHLELSSWGVKISTSQLLTLIAVLVALPSLWLRNLSSISFLSSAGILMSIVIFLSVVCTAVFGFVKTNHGIPILKLEKIPAISGLYIFSYAGHIVFPNLYKAMKDPTKFTKVSIVSFASVTVLYTTLAFLGASMFGSQVSSQITLSMPKSLIFTKIALWATVLTPLTKYALEFAPFAMQLEQNLPSFLNGRAKMIIRGAVGSFLLLIILALALSVPYFEYVLSLTGSLVSVCICIILPCAFFVKLSWARISKVVLILNMGLIAFGSVLGIVGTYSSSKSLVKHLQRAHDHH